MESINKMTTFEFTNKGVDRHYDKPADSDASVNTQFEAMELEEDQVSKNKLFAQNEIDNTNLDCIVTALLINGTLIVATNTLRELHRGYN